jgi:large subunit ribosomal protein L6
MFVSDGKIVRKEIKENIIEVSSDIKVNIENSKITLEKAGETQEITYNPVFVSVNFKDNKLVIRANSKKKNFVSVINTLRKIVLNAISGFDKEYTAKLSIVFSHFPMTVKVEGNDIIISNFLGEKKPRRTKVMPGCKVVVNGKDIVVTGKNKYFVGQTAGNFETTTRVRGKDYRVFDDGIYIVEKSNQLE